MTDKTLKVKGYLLFKSLHFVNMFQVNTYTPIVYEWIFSFIRCHIFWKFSSVYFRPIFLSETYLQILEKSEFFVRIFHPNFSSKFFVQIFRPNFSSKFFVQIFRPIFLSEFFVRIIFCPKQINVTDTWIDWTSSMRATMACDGTIGSFVLKISKPFRRLLLWYYLMVLPNAAFEKVFRDSLPANAIYWDRCYDLKKYFCRKNMRFWLKTKLNYAKSLS
jgi:hypothetical protein